MSSDPAPDARVPPHSQAAEQAVLGSMLLSSAALARADELLTAEEFYKPRHQILFRVMHDLAEKRDAVDLVTLEAALVAHGQSEEIGGMLYLQELFTLMPVATNIEHYVKIVKQKAVLRSLLQVAATITKACYDPPDELDALLDEAEAAIFRVTQARIDRPYHPIKDVVMETYSLLEGLYDRKSAITGTPSGLADLDKITAGFQNSDLIILAARPSIGKTALALSFAVEAAVRQKIPVLLFTLEMSRTQLGLRMLSMEARIDMQLLRTGQFREEHWSSLTLGCGILSESPIYIDDSPQISLREMRSKARRLKSDVGLGLVVVDYLQLMEMKDRRAENRQTEISSISRGLKALARELDVPVLALSQLSRKLEERVDKRPMLSDLRESGAIEQDADVVIFIHREERYKPDSPEAKGVAEIIVAKQRNGPVDNIKAHFHAACGRFADLARSSDR